MDIENFTATMFGVSILVAIGLIIALIAMRIKKKPIKKIAISLGACFAFAVLMAVIGVSSMPDSQNNTTASTNESLPSDTQPVETDTNSDNVDAPKETPQADTSNWDETVKNNIKDFGAGEYTVGTHLDGGRYDITFNGDGNFTVYNGNNLLTNEIGGSNGISKYRAIFVNGSTFKIASMGIHTTPVKQELKSYGDISLYAGYWIVGQDITAGRYKVTAPSGSGNFIIYNSNSVPKTNEILGTNGVQDVTVNLENNDIINIANLNQINFTPAS